ncbi:MAG: Ig-like domain repeat protein [Acidobacteriota bacterium]
MRRQLGGGLALLAAVALPVAARAQYTITSAKPSTISAGAPGAQITIGGTLPTYPSGNYAICFYTVPGPSAASLNPTSTTINIPASYIQSIPPSSFNAGTFTASLYVAFYGETCTGTPTVPTNVYPVTILLPSIASTVQGGVQALNTVTSVQAPPSLLTLLGADYIKGTTVSLDWGTGPGGVGSYEINSGTEIGQVVQPAGAKSLSATVCNQTTNYTYCSSPLSIPINPLVASTGTLSGIPDPSNPGDTVTLTAQFAATTPPKNPAGAPTGSVTFTESSTTLGQAPLVLDTATGALAQAFTGSMTAVPGPTPKLVDMNGDGLKDVVYFDGSGVFYTQLAGVPFGTFGSTMSSQPDPACSVVDDFAVADLNGDGLPDVVFTCEEGSVDQTEVAFGVGDGTVGAAQVISGAYGYQVLLMDVTGDKILDVVLMGAVNNCASACVQGYGFQVFAGDGTGNFSLTANSQTANNPGSQMVMADFDGDGKMDIAELSPGSSTEIDIYLNQGNGTFGNFDGTEQVPNATFPLSGGGEYFQLVTGDFNGDNKPDLAVESAGGGNQVVYAYNVGAPAFFIDSRAFPIRGFAQSLAVGDFNGDGLADIAVTDGTGVVVYDSGFRGFAADYAGLTVSSTDPVAAGLVGDINFDGDADIVVLTQPAGPAPSEVWTSYITSGSATATLPVKFASAGTQPVAATWPGNVNFSGTTANNSFTVNDFSSTTTLTLNGTPTEYGQTASFTATVTSPSGTPTGSVAFLDSGKLLGSAPLVGNTATFSIATLTAGSHSITASYGGDSSFLGSGSLAQTQQVNQATPSVSWTPTVATITYGTALGASQLNATASSKYVSSVAGTFAYTPASGTVLGAGPQTLNVTFTPTDTTDFSAATGTASITVTKVTPTVIWSNPSPITYGTALSGTQLNATATGISGAVAGSFVYTPAAGTVLGAGNGQALSVTFTPTDATDYNGATGGTTINVSKATPAILWSAPAPITYGTALSATQLNATASSTLGAVAGTFVYTPAAATVLGAGNGQALSVSFTPTDAADYNATTGGTTINVGKATPTITWSTPAGITYGTALSATQLNATATGTLGAVAGTFNYTPAAGTVLSAGSQALNVTFTPTDAVDYNGATGGTTIAVGKATPTINWSAPAPISYGTALSGTQLNATATGISGAVAGTFVYTPAAGTVLSAGTQALSVTFTPTDVTDYSTAIGGTSITVGKATPVLTWPPPAAIVQGTPLSGTQLNATAAGVSGALAGTFVYTPAAGTVLAAGTARPLSVTFTPTDAVDYATATLGTTIDVLTLGVTSITPPTANLGDAAKTVTLVGVGFLANSVVQVNGTAIATTFVNATTLMAVIPASNFTTAQTLSVTVVDPTQGQTSTAVNFVVNAPTATAVFTGPTTVQPAQQPGLTFTLGAAYPVPITATVTLTFAGTGGADDPAIQFAAGGRTYTFTIPANSTTIPTIQLQSGTDAGTITATMVLTAGGKNITPANIVPLTIVIPPVAPSLTSATLARSGQSITVTLIGFSNTRNATQAVFHFVAGPNAYIDNPDVTVNVTNLFTTWFADPTSQAYGSEFLYTQTFNLNTDQSSIASVTVTLTNSAGNSATATAQ